MGKPEQNSVGTVIAVLVVGLLLLMFILGGAAVLVGGLFFASYQSPPQTMQMPATEYEITDLVVNGLIEIDETGQITLDGEVQTIEELRATLNEPQREGTPLISAHPNCPHSVVAEVAFFVQTE